MKYMLFIRVALLGLFGFIGSVFGMEQSSGLPMIIVNPIVKKVFLSDNKKIGFTAVKSDDDYLWAINDCDGYPKNININKLLCIIKKQLNEIKPINQDIFEVSYTTIGLNQKMDYKSIQEHNILFRYINNDNNRTSWFSHEEMKSGYKMQIFKERSSSTQELYACVSICDEYGQDRIKDNFYIYNICPIIYNTLALHLLKNSIYYIFSNQTIIAEIDERWVGLNKYNEEKKNNELTQGQCDYDSGYENCNLRINADYDCRIKNGNLWYQIQDVDYKNLLQVCKEEKQFIIKVRNSTEDSSIKMRIIDVEHGSFYYNLKESEQNEYAVLQATLVDKDYPQKFTTMQNVRYLFRYYGDWMVTGFFSLSMLVMWVYCNKY